MLAGFRSITRSWLVRGVLGIVALTMAITLVTNPADLLGGVFKPRGLASVAGQDISPNQLNREIELFIRNQRNNGQEVTREQVIEAGVHQRLLESMIERRAIHALAMDLGVRASDTQAADTIRNIPVVQNPLTGSFDEAAYQRFLQESGFTHAELVREIRGDLSGSMLMESLITGVRAPASYGAMVLAFETERRTITIAEAPASLVEPIPPPTPAQLQTFYEESAARLQTPEYRALTIVYARNTDFVGRVNIPEARLQEEFETRRASLSRPERRTFVQISAPDEARAREAAQRMARGEAPDVVAQAMNLQVVRAADQVQSEAADSAIATAVFAMRAGAPPSAVRGRLTPWAAVQLESITPAVTPSFESERETIRTALAQDEAAEMLNAAVTAFEDARSEGTPIADAARAANLAVVVVPAVNEQGLTPTGEPAEALVDQPELIRAAFETAEGEASEFMPVGDADVILQVDRITPAATRPLDEVREQLTQAFIGRERQRRLQELGTAFITAVRGGQTFAEAARANRFTLVVRSQPIGRREAGQLPSPDLAAQIFDANQNDVVTGMRVDGGSILAAQVEAITRTTPAEAPEMVEMARQQMQQSLTQTVNEIVTAAALERAHVRRNDELMQRTFAAEADPAADGSQ